MLQKTIILLSIFYFLLSTEVKSQYSDCSSLLKLTDTSYTSPVIVGYGNVKEFNGNTLENNKVFEQEANSIWYLITVPDSGLFTFDIVAASKFDDWDFLLYDYKSKFCKRIEAKKIVPIRTNLSRSPLTGLSKKATENFVGAGIHDSYSKAVVANKGQQFVLVVNNPKKSGGKHSLILHYPQKEEPVKIVPINESEEAAIETILFKFSVKDANTKELLMSDVILSGFRGKTLEMDTITSFQTSIIKANYDVYLMAHAKGYMLASKEFKISKDKEVYYTEILLEEITVGKKVNLKNIQFYGNRFDFLPSAKDDLKALLSFMKKNPTVAIEIEGHVNGPNEKNTNAYKELSNNRAKAVKEYLMENNIEEGRINSIGYGNSQMLFPNPKSEREHSENRRVEIKILAK
jgi:outer membrane protein OmpA-like peptidoglycan-associated protein